MIVPAGPGVCSGSDQFRPYLLVGHVLAALVILMCCKELVDNIIHPTSRDFISFWGAAKLASRGMSASAYDGAVLHALQAKFAQFEANTAMPFPYAPAFLLLVLPFAYLPFGVAMAAWTGVTLAVYAMIARAFAPGSRWLAVSFPPVIAIAAVGQNGFVTAACFIGGLLLLARNHRFAAGLVLGCLVIKPQLALMLPVAMIAGREWRVIVGSALSAVAVLLTGVAVFGSATSLAWLGQAPLYAVIARDGLVGWHKLASIYAACRSAGLAEQTSFLIHFTVALAAAAMVAQVWRSRQPLLLKAGVLGAATMLASPYVYLYDALVLFPAYVWLVTRRAPLAAVAILWLFPIIVLAQTAGFVGFVNLAPMLPICLLIACVAINADRVPDTNRPGRASTPFQQRHALPDQRSRT